MHPLRLFLFLLVLTLGSSSLVHAKNLCSVTLGSDDELKFYKSVLQKNGELSQSYEISRPGWDFTSSFKDFCQRQIPCDVLVISSHYDGIDFYGEDLKSKLKKPGLISKDQLMDYASQNICPQFFTAPKEVYLFGCNTLAKNNLYQRSPEQYAESLRKAGMNEYDIQRITAERFSSTLSFGILTYDLMRALFPNALITGYMDIGIAGPRAVSYLKNFSGSSSQLPEYLQKKVPGMIVAEGLQRRSDAAASLKMQRILRLHSIPPGKNISAGLQIINQIFREQDVGSYLPEIESFLFRHREALEDITANPSGQQSLLKYWQDIQKKNQDKDKDYLIGVRLSSIFILLNWPTDEFDRFREE